MDFPQEIRRCTFKKNKHTERGQVEPVMIFIIEFENRLGKELRWIKSIFEIRQLYLKKRMIGFVAHFYDAKQIKI
jgi:hypothetical protein